jgi:hypothetical protein
MDLCTRKVTTMCEPVDPWYRLQNGHRRIPRIKKNKKKVPLYDNIHIIHHVYVEHFPNRLEADRNTRKLNIDMH